MGGGGGGSEDAERFVADSVEADAAGKDAADEKEGCKRSAIAARTGDCEATGADGVNGVV